MNTEEKEQVNIEAEKGARWINMGEENIVKDEATVASSNARIQESTNVNNDADVDGAYDVDGYGSNTIMNRSMMLLKLKISHLQTKRQKQRLNSTMLIETPLLQLERLKRSNLPMSLLRKIP